MSTLSPIDPKVTFHSLELLVCDAQSIVDALCGEINRHFAVSADKHGRYVLDEQDGNRLFFLASLATAMTDKARDAYYVAWENQNKESAS